MICIAELERIYGIKNGGDRKSESRPNNSDLKTLKQLIETNLRQRGIGNTNMIKLGRCSEELKRIYDIKQGRPSSEKNTNNVRNFTQKDIADSAGVSVRVLQNAERLAKLPEDIQQMVLDGVVTPSVASRVIAKLSPEEQAQLAEQISGKEKVTGSEVQQYIDELKAAREENAKLRTAISEQGARNAELQHRDGGSDFYRTITE